MALPVARKTDFHFCPLQSPSPHIGGPIESGSSTVFACKQAVGRRNDTVTCIGPTDYIAQGSATVLIEGKPAARMTDLCFHGGLILTGCPTVLIGGPRTECWTIQGLLDILCPKDCALVDDIRNNVGTLSGYGRIYYNDPYYDGTRWTTRLFEGAGSSGAGGIAVLNNESNESVAVTFKHEMHHHHQPSSMSWLEKEYDAYTTTEQWTIDRGLPSQGQNFRTVDANGNTVPNVAEIRNSVDRAYPIATTAAGDRVIGHDSVTNEAILERPDGTTYRRPPQSGDTHAGPEITEDPRSIDPSMFHCP